MQEVRTKIAVAATVAALAGLTGVALSSGGDGASEATAEGQATRPKVVRRTIHVTKRADAPVAAAPVAAVSSAPAAPASVSTSSSGSGASAPVTTSSSGSGDGDDFEDRADDRADALEDRIDDREDALDDRIDAREDYADDLADHREDLEDD